MNEWNPLTEEEHTPLPRRTNNTAEVQASLHKPAPHKRLPKPVKPILKKMDKPRLKRLEAMGLPRTTSKILQRLAKDAIESEASIPSDIPAKEVVGKFGLMHPTSFALEHEAADMLLEWSEKGCPVDTGPNWSRNQIEEAIKRGPHKSAHEDGAVEFLINETNEKVKYNYAKVVRYGDIQENLPSNLKISPVSMIPHKSKLFRCILDLSFQLKNPRTGKKWDSVNSATTKLSKQQSMGQLGSVVKRIVATMADHYDPGKPFMFTKLDIKDRFWRMAVSNEAAWNFCYVLPSNNKDLPLEDTMIVVPNSLQMGWTESPPCFCAGTETARDLMEIMLPLVESLNPHPLEKKMEQATEGTNEQKKEPAKSNEHDDKTPFKTLFEVFVDDFMAATNQIDPKNLTKISRVMLHAIHCIFPPPEVTGHKGEDSISVSKIDNGDGKWSYLKEILGWIIDGKDYTITLPKSKLKKITNEVNKAVRMKKVPLKQFQELAGKLQHASFAMPGGWGLFSPVQAAMQGSPKIVDITPELVGRMPAGLENHHLASDSTSDPCTTAGGWIPRFPRLHGCL